MLLSLVKVEGHSMEPKLKNGSFFIASSIPFLFTAPKVGDIVLFRSKEKIIVKRITELVRGKYQTSGDNRSDDKKFPPVEKNNILGKVIIAL